MALVAFAPLVSQIVAHEAARMDAILAVADARCSTHPVGAAVSAALSMDAIHGTGDGHTHHDKGFGACGYCHFVLHYASMPALASVSLVGDIAGPVDVSLLPDSPFLPQPAFLSAQPRAPPVSLQPPVS